MFFKEGRYRYVVDILMRIKPDFGSVRMFRSKGVTIMCFGMLLKPECRSHVNKTSNMDSVPQILPMKYTTSNDALHLIPKPNVQIRHYSFPPSSVFHILRATTVRHLVRQSIALCRGNLSRCSVVQST